MSHKRHGIIDWSSLTKVVPLSNFFKPAHPEVFLIPPKFYHQVVDEWGDYIGISQMFMPFSSFNFYVELEEGGVFNAIYCNPKFCRLGGISQLGYLCPPRPDGTSESSKIYYQISSFKNTRWGHSFLTGILAELVLAKNGFSRQDRYAFVIAAACHDIATPAGGDSVIRLDPPKLSEELNFRLVMEDVAGKWSEQFGFDLDLAVQWVINKGPFGVLLDVLDKMAYTAYDAYYATCVPGICSRIRKLCQKHPRIMNIWQDIRFDGEKVWFVSPNRLYYFLLLRAYLFSDVYYHPRCRALDNVLYNQVKKYYYPDLWKKLITWSDADLHAWLLEKGEPEKILRSPDILKWRKFSTEEEAHNYSRRVKNFSHFDQIKPFKTGLDWLVNDGSTFVKIQSVLSSKRIEFLEHLSRCHAGWYVYYFKE